MRLAAVLLLVVAAVASARAQRPSGPAAPPSNEQQVYRTVGARIAIGRSIQVPADEEVSDAVVVVGGSLRVDGRVRDGVVVIGGNLDVGPKADVRGEIVVVGGRISRAPGAQIRGRVSDVSFGDWRTWSIGGVSVPTVDFGEFGRWVSLAGTFFRLALLAAIMGIIIVVARAPVARIGRSAAAEPGRAFLLGLVAEVMFLPALVIGSIGLAVTIIGIPLLVILVPLSIAGAFVGLLLGFTALTCRMGEWLEDRLGLRANSAFLATTLGLLLIAGPTIAARVATVASEPLRVAAIALLVFGLTFEFVVWTMGFGATLMTGFGRWSTAPPPLPPSTQALPVVG